MTESEWLVSTNLDAMLAVRQVRNRKRKLRLFAIASVRQLAPYVTDPRLWDVLTACERAADGEIKDSGLEKWKALANRVWLEIENAPRKRNHRARLATCNTFMHMALAGLFGRTGADRADNIPFHTLENIDREFPPAFIASLREVYPQLLRDIVGNPFRTIVFDRRWRTTTLVGLASTMYDARNFNAMPILADALQEAGCENDVILRHCRDEHQPHIRGCWVVDLVLGKT